MSMGGFVALIAFGEKLSLPRAQIRPGIRPTLDNDTPYPTADIELQRRQGGGGGGGGPPPGTTFFPPSAPARSTQLPRWRTKEVRLGIYMP
jgi:hypothetical protein